MFMNLLKLFAIFLSGLCLFSCKSPGLQDNHLQSLVGDPLLEYANDDEEMPVFPVSRLDGEGGLLTGVWKYPDQALMMRFGPTKKADFTLSGFLIRGDFGSGSSDSTAKWNKACNSWKAQVQKQFQAMKVRKINCGSRYEVGGSSWRYISYGSFEVTLDVPKTHPTPTYLKGLTLPRLSVNSKAISSYQTSCDEQLKFYRKAFGHRYLLGHCGYKQSRDNSHVEGQVTVLLFPLFIDAEDKSFRYEPILCGQAQSTEEAASQSFQQNLALGQKQIIDFLGGTRMISGIEIHPLQKRYESGRTQFCAQMKFELNFPQMNERYSQLRNERVIMPAVSSPAECYQSILKYRSMFQGTALWGSCEHAFKEGKFLDTNPRVVLHLAPGRTGNRSHSGEAEGLIEVRLPVCGLQGDQNESQSSLNNHVVLAQKQIINYVGGAKFIKGMGMGSPAIYPIGNKEIRCADVTISVYNQEGQSFQNKLNNHLLTYPGVLPSRDPKRCQGELRKFKNIFGSRYIYGSCEDQIFNKKLMHPTPILKVWLEPLPSAPESQSQEIKLEVCGKLTEKVTALRSFSERVEEVENTLMSRVGGASFVEGISLASSKINRHEGQMQYCSNLVFKSRLAKGNPLISALQKPLLVKTPELISPAEANQCSLFLKKKGLSEASGFLLGHCNHVFQDGKLTHPNPWLKIWKMDLEVDGQKPTLSLSSSICGAPKGDAKGGYTSYQREINNFLNYINNLDQGRLKMSNLFFSHINKKNYDRMDYQQHQYCANITHEIPINSRSALVKQLASKVILTPQVFETREQCLSSVKQYQQKNPDGFLAGYCKYKQSPLPFIYPEIWVSQANDQKEQVPYETTICSSPLDTNRAIINDYFRQVEKVKSMFQPLSPALTITTSFDRGEIVLTPDPGRLRFCAETTLQLNFQDQEELRKKFINRKVISPDYLQDDCEGRIAYYRKLFAGRFLLAHCEKDQIWIAPTSFNQTTSLKKNLCTDKGQNISQLDKQYQAWHQDLIKAAGGVNTLNDLKVGYAKVYRNKQDVFYCAQAEAEISFDDQIRISTEQIQFTIGGRGQGLSNYQAWRKKCQAEFNSLQIKYPERITSFDCGFPRVVSLKNEFESHGSFELIHRN